MCNLAHVFRDYTLAIILIFAVCFAVLELWLSLYNIRLPVFAAAVENRTLYG